MQRSFTKASLFGALFFVDLSIARFLRQEGVERSKREALEALTGAAVEPDWTLAECGLASVAAPLVRRRLVAALPGVTLALSDLVEADTVVSLAALLDERRKRLKATGLA